MPNSTIWNSVIVAHDKSSHAEAFETSSPPPPQPASKWCDRGQPSNSGATTKEPAEPVADLSSVSAGTVDKDNVKATDMDTVTVDTATLQSLRRVAEKELSALQEHQQGRAMADSLHGLTYTERKVVLWLGSDPEQKKQTSEWRAFVAASGGVPTWVPGELAARVSP